MIATYLRKAMAAQEVLDSAKLDVAERHESQELVLCQDDSQIRWAASLSC